MPDTPIGTNSPDYTLVTGDLGANIYCKVTATNASGTANADSNTVGPVTAAPVVGAYVYLGDAEGAGDDSIVSPAVDTTGAGLLVVAIADYTSANTVADSKGNTWTQTPASVGGSARIFYSRPTTVGSGHTITVSNVSPPIYSSACFIAFSGGVTSPFDLEVIDGGTGATATAGSTLPTNDNSLIISIVSIADAGGGSSSVGSGFTKICDLPRAGQFGLTVGYLIQGTAAAVNPSWSIATMNSWEARNAVFKSV